MRTLPTLTRLVFIVHGKDYEFRKNLFTGVITGEKILISRGYTGMGFGKINLIFFFFLHLTRVRRGMIVSITHANFQKVIEVLMVSKYLYYFR